MRKPRTAAYGRKWIFKQRRSESASGTAVFLVSHQVVTESTLRCSLLRFSKSRGVRSSAHCALYAALPDYLRVPLVIGYWTGMRAGEILSLRWDQLDLTEGRIRLEPRTTKNGHGRTIPLVEQVVYTLKEWRESTRLRYPTCPWVCHYSGRRLQKIPKRMWRQTCERAGLRGKLFHDLWRTAVRNMVRAGISERVAMEISSHRTRSVFDRYDIVSEADFSNAIVRLQQGIH